MRQVVEQARSAGAAALQSTIEEGSALVSNEIRERIGRMVQGVASKTQDLGQRFVGVNEEEILTFIPDKRALSGISAALLGLMFLVISPGFLWPLALVFFLFGVGMFLLGYVNNSKVDVPDGYEGVICHNGLPMPTEKAKRGRNYMFAWNKFVPFLVSRRDQVVDSSNANFTGDFATVSMRNQLVFEIADSSKFITTTSPATAMKILSIYSSYTALRMITSITDARVKFVGRDRLDNVVEILNSYLQQQYGIKVKRATMPEADNAILDDFEQIRTTLKQTEAMGETRQVQMEAAIKDIETQIRTKRKNSRGKALELESTRITLDTTIGKQLNAKKQQVMMRARRELDEAISNVKMELAKFKSRVEKVKVIREVFASLKTGLGLREAAIKRSVFKLLVPTKVKVLGVPGIGAGFGMAMGNEMLGAMMRDTSKVDEGGDKK